MTVSRMVWSLALLAAFGLTLAGCGNQTEYTETETPGAVVEEPSADDVIDEVVEETIEEPVIEPAPVEPVEVDVVEESELTPAPVEAPEVELQVEQEPVTDAEPEAANAAEAM